MFKLQDNDYFYCKPCNMVGKIDKTPQLNIFKVPLLSFIREDHELCLFVGFPEVQSFKIRVVQAP